MAFSTPFFIFTELALRNVYLTLREPPPFRVFFTVRLSTTVSAFLLVSTFFMLFHGSLPDARLMAPLIVLKVADSLLDMCFAELQCRQRIREAALLGWANTALSMLVIGLVIWLLLSPELAIFGSAASSMIAFVVGLRRCVRRTVKSPWLPSRDQLSRILHAGALLGLAQGMVALLTFLPTFYLAYASVPSAVGVFAVCQYVVTSPTCSSIVPSRHGSEVCG